MNNTQKETQRILKEVEWKENTPEQDHKFLLWLHNKGNLQKLRKEINNGFTEAISLALKSGKEEVYRSGFNAGLAMKQEASYQEGIKIGEGKRDLDYVKNQRIAYLHGKQIGKQELWDGLIRGKFSLKGLNDTQLLEIKKEHKLN